ncbi:MAG: A/G-specific adenine glycosylase [Clostridia bacterium]|nr:A/G-specific adenine glycosylase [Clostridia bacterium]
MQQNLQAIAAPLVAWYQENKRLLPWRRDKDPYHVWVSEIMLQQTRIEAVTEHYFAFMAALPTVQHLAEVPEERLLKLWEGLGYYSRARNLKKAAQVIVETYGGSFPRSYAELIKLPGIGQYTAGAIASICFNEKVPAVDGNVLRVLARLQADSSNVLLPETKKRAEGLLRAIMPEEAGDFNEGLMELGETVCLPNGLPLCESCPLSAQCRAHAENRTAELPVRIKKTQRKKEQKTVFLFYSPQGELALRKRPAKGLLAGLYELPHVDTFLEEPGVRAQAQQWGLEPTEIAFLKDCKHLFTHIEWQMRCFTVAVKEKNDQFDWCTAESLESDYALPTAFAKCMD